MIVKMSDRRQRRRQDHIIMYNDGIPVVGMHREADWPRENARTYARTHVRRAAGLYASLHRSQGIFMD